ncbi:MAG: 3-isopropylmalate dehydratase [Chloroflexi bacterium]|nr:3-isopropylmalate dehydratase [Chloroflexota bacterium]
MFKEGELRGHAWVFGDFMGVDFEILPWDVIVQRRIKGISELTEKELGKYCMTNVDPEFPAKVGDGDFIIGGKNFGCGHDHYHACRAIKGAGVAAVVCESSNTNFVRNSIHTGLPVIVYKGIRDKVVQGNELEIDLAKGTISILTTSQELRFKPYPDFLLKMILEGGLYAQLERQIAEG